MSRSSPGWRCCSWGCTAGTSGTGRTAARPRAGWPGWGDASTTAVFTTSVLVDLQPKGLVLGLSAGAVVRGGSMPVAEAVVAVVLYLALASSSVLLPVIASAVSPTRTEHWLTRAQDWLTAHGSVLTAAVAALVGVVLMVDAVGRF